MLNKADNRTFLTNEEIKNSTKEMIRRPNFEEAPTCMSWISQLQHQILKDWQNKWTRWPCCDDYGHGDDDDDGNDDDDDGDAGHDDDDDNDDDDGDDADDDDDDGDDDYNDAAMLLLLLLILLILPILGVSNSS